MECVLRATSPAATAAITLHNGLTAAPLPPSSVSLSLKPFPLPLKDWRKERRSFLRSSRSASLVHASSSSSAQTATAGSAEPSYPSLAESPQVPFLDPTSGSPSPFPATSGVYAIYDKDGVLQYLGLSRRLNASLAIHLSELPELCGSVKVLEVRAPERTVLVEAWKHWMEDHVSATGGPPSGNAQGNATWTTRKAKPAKPEIRILPGSHVQLTVPMIEIIDKIVKENRTVLFIKGTRTSPECGFSHRVLTIMNELRVEYETLNVLDEEHNPGLRDAVKEYSQWPTIPQVYVKGEFVGGADIITEMAENGQLKELLLSS